VVEIIDNLATECACDLTKLWVSDISHGQHVAPRVIVMQQKTKRPVQFEIMEQTRKALKAWIRLAHLGSEDRLFPSRIRDSVHLSNAAVRSHRQIMGRFNRSRSRFLRHSYVAPNQSNADLQGNQESEGRAVTPRTHQAGKHRMLFGIEVDDALEISEQTEF
jgi:hypothetical protein